MKPGHSSMKKENDRVVSDGSYNNFILLFERT